MVPPQIIFPEKVQSSEYFLLRWPLLRWSLHRKTLLTWSSPRCLQWSDGPSLYGSSLEGYLLTLSLLRGSLPQTVPHQKPLLHVVPPRSSSPNKVLPHQTAHHEIVPPHAVLPQKATSSCCPPQMVPVERPCWGEQGVTSDLWPRRRLGSRVLHWLVWGRQGDTAPRSSLPFNFGWTNVHSLLLTHPYKKYIKHECIDEQPCCSLSLF
jgi:hypothetical protein